MLLSGFQRTVQKSSQLLQILSSAISDCMSAILWRVIYEAIVAIVSNIGLSGFMSSRNPVVIGKIVAVRRGEKLVAFIILALDL